MTEMLSDETDFNRRRPLTETVTSGISFSVPIRWWHAYFTLNRPLETQYSVREMKAKPTRYTLWMRDCSYRPAVLVLAGSAGQLNVTCLAPTAPIIHPLPSNASNARRLRTFWRNWRGRRKKTTQASTQRTQWTQENKRNDAADANNATTKTQGWKRCQFLRYVCCVRCVICVDES